LAIRKSGYVALFIAGRPIIDAHRYESQLQWIGVMITPSV